MIFGSKQRVLVGWWGPRSPYKDMDGIIAEGSIRSGKTYAMVTGFLMWSVETFEGESFIMAGRTMGALKRNVVKPLLRILNDIGWDYRYNRSEGFIEIGRNTYYLFGASNESSQDFIQGLTAAGCYADEVALFPESFVSQMVGRCSVEGSKLWFNCNPSYPTHFVKTDYIDRAEELGLLHLKFQMHDNPTLSPRIIERYERMFTGVFYDRYILGLWTLAEGIVYPGYVDAFEDFRPPKDAQGRTLAPKRRMVSLDYGTQNPTHALMWELHGSVWHCVKEYRYDGRSTGHQKTDADYVADMQAFCGGRDLEVIIDPSASSFMAAMRRAGFRVRKADNDVLNGIRETAVSMQQGLIRIDNGCEGLKKEFAGYVWDEKADGDRPVKENDHGMDALRYFVRTMRVYRPAESYTSPYRERVRGR